MPLLDTEPESVALVRLRTGLGDLLCTVPALRALRTRLPRAHIAMVTYPEMASVVARMSPWVDELIGFPGDPDIPERPPRSAEERAAFYAAMRARGFDVALQVYGARTAANRVTAALGARSTGGFFVTGEWSADLTTSLPYPQHRHEIWRHLDLMALLGAESQGAELEFPLSAGDGEAAEAVLAAERLDRGPFAVLHPGATSQSRRWPLERWAAVGDDLARQGLAVAVTGVAEEAPMTAELVGRMAAPVADLAGRTDLGGFAALLARAGLLVCADTGAAHLAAAVRIPSVVLFQSGDPVRWAHPDPRHRVARMQVECNPCPHLVCPIDHRCAEALTPRRVLDEVAALAPLGSGPERVYHLSHED